MTISSLDNFILELQENYNYLKEREATYAHAAPVYLLNQLKHYERATQLAEQARKQNLNLEDLQAEFDTFNLDLDERIIFVDQEITRTPFTGQNPYRGLEKFTENDHEFFFGRDDAIQKLLKKVGYLVETETSREVPDLLAIIGPSGSGKSSLVRAGLIPALREGKVPKTKLSTCSDQWQIKIMIPGTSPLTALGKQLTRLTGRGLPSILEDLRTGPKALHLLIAEAMAEQDEHDFFVLVIDQFEEIFTQCPDEQERRLFIDQLLYEAQHAQNQALIIITMRADFYSKLALYKNLAEAVTAHQMLVSPMTGSELREAILKPAEAVGLELEKDLVEALVRDTHDAPGSLPLLQHALLELFERRDDYLLTMAAYKEIEGVQGALAHRADSVFIGLNPEQQRLARNIFIRLTSLGEGVSDTRRRVSRTELYPLGEDPAQIDVVLQALTAQEARLVVTDEETVEVTHEALIQQWETLREWLEDDRDALRTHRRLTNSATEWDTNNQDPSYLYRGALLSGAREWATQHQNNMTAIEHAFLQAGIDATEKEEKERRSRNQKIIIGLSIGLILVAIGAIFGFVGQNQASAEAVRANTEAANAAQQATAAYFAQETAVANESTAISAQKTAEIEKLAAETNASEAEKYLMAQQAVQSELQRVTITAEAELRFGLVEELGTYLNTRAALLETTLTAQADRLETPTPTSSITPVPTTTPTGTYFPSPTESPTPFSTYAANVTPDYGATALVQDIQAELALIHALATRQVEATATARASARNTNCKSNDALTEIWKSYSIYEECPFSEALGGYFIEQPFENGYMFWSQIRDEFFVTVGDTEGVWYHFSKGSDTFLTPPQLTCEVDVPAGLVQPANGFGAIWCSQDAIRDEIGFGTEKEFGVGNNLMQDFEDGVILRDSKGQIYIMFSNSTYTIEEQ